MTYREAFRQACLELGHSEEEARAAEKYADRKCMTGASQVNATIPTGHERDVVQSFKAFLNAPEDEIEKMHRVADMAVRENLKNN